MHGTHNTCQKCMHTLRKKCIWTRACAPARRCRSFFAMEAIANLSWVLREHRVGCRLPSALAAPPAVSTKPVALRCSLKKSVQIHAHDAVAAAVSHKHHSIICVGTALIQFVYESHSRLATGVTSSRILFLPFFRANFNCYVLADKPITSLVCISCGILLFLPTRRVLGGAPPLSGLCHPASPLQDGRSGMTSRSSKHFPHFVGYPGYSLLHGLTRWHTMPHIHLVLEGLKIVMKSGDVFISGFWLGESNPVRLVWRWYTNW